MQLRAKRPFRSPWLGYTRRGAIFDAPDDVAEILLRQGHVTKAVPDVQEVMTQEAEKAAPKKRGRPPKNKAAPAPENKAAK